MSDLELSVLKAKIADRLIEAYNKRSFEVAAACDTVIDRSGNLLCWLRDAAYYRRSLEETVGDK